MIRCWGCEAGFFSFLFSHLGCWWGLYALSLFLSFLLCAVPALMLSISPTPSFALLFCDGDLLLMLLLHTRPDLYDCDEAQPIR